MGKRKTKETGGNAGRGAANPNGGETRGENTRRAFERGAATLAAMGAASWRRWGEARRVLSYGFEMATDGAAGYDDILNRHEMLRAVECLINDPPEIARAFLMPNPNPIQGGAVCDKDCREWILATFREWFEGFYTFGGELGFDNFAGNKWAIGQKDGRGVWRWGKLSTMRFYMFPACLNLACFALRETWADFIEKCGLPEFDGLKNWLANDRAENKRCYSRMGDLYECAYSEEQYFDLQTGESNAPKYGGGGVRATALLLNFRDYLRGRQGVKDCESFTPPNNAAANGCEPATGAAQGAANPSGNAGGGIATDTPSAPKKQRAGHTAGGVSQSEMAEYMGVTKRTIQNWENHADRYPPPIVDGAQYTAAIRENGAGAFMFAARYKDTKRGAGKTIGGKGAEIEHEKAALRKWKNGGRDNFYGGISD